MHRIAEHQPFDHWHETHDVSGQPRPVYTPLFARIDDLPRSEVRGLDERLEATMREMGVTFDITRERPWGKRPWFCDILPQIFTTAEWDPLARGVTQRIRAFEMFLQDIYGEKEILRSGTLPVQPVLGSLFFQRAAAGLPRPGDAFLHLSGVCVTRLPDGEFAVKHHYFSNASGLSYMIQNRRALSRVIPQSFEDFAIHAIADSPVEVLEMLRGYSDHPDPTVVLLSPGPGSAVYSEHSFLARRMGIPLVQGGDLLVLGDAVYLKTVSGLEKVEVIYSRISDQWMDPMVFQRDSLLGVPGLVHCIRRGSVAVVNAIGSQLADDRALLTLAAPIIRFYLGEHPEIRGLSTYWLGDIDQREMVIADLGRYTIRPLYGEKILLGGDGREPDEASVEAARAAIRENPSAYVAQPQNCDAATYSFHDGRKAPRLQDHILFALRRRKDDYEVFPGALTRVSTDGSPFTANELGGGSKDTWVEATVDVAEVPQDRARARETPPPSQHVSSRVAESFYWTGRYLERAHSLAVMIGVIESLELEELNPTERTLYRPVWNLILPPLEKPGSVSRRNISSPGGRYRLTFGMDEPDSAVRTLLRAARNAESVLEELSLDAWTVLDRMRVRFERMRFRPDARETELTRVTRSMCDVVRRSVPEFFGTAQSTMVGDGGWAFCEIGQMIERAIITANAVVSIMRPMPRRGRVTSHEHESEIRLSAFLRLLNSRDVYRRVYQMRIEPAPVLDLLWKHPSAPRSIARCLTVCASRLRSDRTPSSPATDRTAGAIETLIHAIRQVDWEELIVDESTRDTAVSETGRRLLDSTLGVHDLIADGFLNHQIHMGADAQPLLFGS